MNTSLQASGGSSLLCSKSNSIVNILYIIFVNKPDGYSCTPWVFHFMQTSLFYHEKSKKIQFIYKKQFIFYSGLVSFNQVLHHLTENHKLVT